MDEGQRIIIHSADSSQQQHKLFILFYFSLSFLKKNILRQQSEFNEWKTTDYSLFSLHFPLLNDGDSLLHTRTSSSFFFFFFSRGRYYWEYLPTYCTHWPHRVETERSSSPQTCASVSDEWISFFSGQSSALPSKTPQWQLIRLSVTPLFLIQDS